MDLRPYVENLQRQLAGAAQTDDEESRALTERLVASLEPTARLTLLDALTAAAGEITTELAPGSIELRLRGREVRFAVQPPFPHGGEAAAGADDEPAAGRGGSARAPLDAGADEGGVARINVRMPEQLKSRVDRAAAAEGLSVNAWLVRAAATALERPTPEPRPGRRATKGQRYTGWAR
jgi:hypothetical protein